MTNPLGRLRELIETPDKDDGRIRLRDSTDMDAVLSRLERRIRNVGAEREPVELQASAVRRFWEVKQVSSVQEARRVAFGLSLPIGRDGACVLEDRERLEALLSGIDRWVGDPRRFRRCYQGLMANYFGYDAHLEGALGPGKVNWALLRSYLHERSGKIGAAGLNPDWVTCALANTALFGEAPCAAFADELLRGEDSTAEYIRNALGIDGSSWFVRALLTAQFDAAVGKVDEEFVKLVPHLLGVLERNPVLRDQGMSRLLNRYAVSSTALHQGLRDSAIRWWGNPWMESNAMRWGAVTPKTRAMVTEWLKLEFIETFFTLLAEEGVGEQRRLDFWKRYVKSIDHIQFALGPDALTSRSDDFVAVRKKMTGLVSELRDATTSNNAFVMTIGGLVVVEFSGRANACYGYDLRKGFPFDLSRPVVNTKNARNSLKRSNRDVWLNHMDGIHGFLTWEQRFEALLLERYGITSDSATRRIRARSPYSATIGETRPALAVRESPSDLDANRAVALPYSRTNLDKYARTNGLTIEDKTGVGGALWVRSASLNTIHDGVLSNWGFRFKNGKGWWK